MPLPIGSSSFALRFLGHEITVEAFKPPTYAGQPLLIVLPGVVRSATNARNDATGLACRCACLVAAPHLSSEAFPDNDYDHGRVFPNDAYDPDTGALRRPTPPNPRGEWSLNVVLEVFNRIRIEEGNPDLRYYLFGDGAGGQFINAFGFFLYPLLSHPERPVRMVVANLGVATFPGLPVMKQDAVRVDCSPCYTGPNSQLTTRSRAVLEDGCCLGEAHIDRHYDFARRGPFIFEDRCRFRPASSRQLPYPYGLGNIVPTPSVGRYLRAPFTFFMGERDVNVNGGINPQCEVVFPIDHGPFDLLEGPFRLFKNLNCFLTGHSLALRMREKCCWKALVAFATDHNAAAMLSATNAARAVFGRETCRLIRNARYLRQYVVPGASPLVPGLQPIPCPTAGSPTGRVRASRHRCGHQGRRKEARRSHNTDVEAV